MLARRIDQSACPVEFGGRNVVLLHQGSFALVVAQCIRQGHVDTADFRLLRNEPGARYRDGAVRGVLVRACLVDAQIEGRRVDASDDLVLLYLRIEIGIDLLHLTGNLRTDLHGGYGIQRSARRHDGGERAALESGQAIARALGTVELP